MLITFSAAISTFIAVTQLQPCVIVNAGTAGGFRKSGAAIGDAWIGTQFYNHDRRIPIPGFDEYGKGGYSAFPTPKLVEVAFSIEYLLKILSLLFFLRRLWDTKLELLPHPTR